jgi:transglutaminase-like putative cysteine protease
MRYRLTITAALAVLAASFSLFTVISGAGWLWASLGAVIVAAAVGLASRVTGIPAAATASGLMLVAVMPLLAGSTWPERIGGVLLVAAMAGSALTRRVLPALAVAGSYLAALFLYLNLAFASAQSWAWFIPTARSVHRLGRLVSAGFGEHIYAPPVPGGRGLELIAAAGVGLVAILTDLIAVRLRSPAVAGLPLLVLFSVPVATNVKTVGVGLTLAFCLGISGYLALLTADGRERLRLWGRLVTVWQETPEDEDSRGPDTRALAASGRRIGLAAVALAVIVPLVLPSVKEHGVFGTNPAPGSNGSSGIKVTAPQPLVLMKSQLRAHTAEPVLTYSTDAKVPAQQYLQMYVMNYDGKSAWTLQPRNPSISVSAQSLPGAPGLAPDTGSALTRTSITIGKNLSGGAVTYLPVPYAPEVLTGLGAGWQETKSTLMLYAFKPDAGLHYTVISRTAQPTAAERQAGGRIPASIRRTYLSYPGPNRAQLAKIAAHITARAHTPFSRALALQNYFTDPRRFTYALRGNLPTSVLQFLTTDRRGFCQQFAFSMAVLARLAGIPSRVAVGYTAGSPQRNHTWQVTTSDAHAWPELYFPRTGWLRFEPTPGGLGGQGTATQPGYSNGSGTGGGTGPAHPGGGPSNPSVLGPGGTSNLAPGQLDKPINEPGGGAAGHGGAASGGFPVGLVVLLVIAVLLIAPGLGRLLTRRRRWLRASDDAGRAHAAWRELTCDLVDLGLGGAASESPRALAARITASAGLDEPARAALSRLAVAEERARYARTPATGDTLQADGRTVRRALAKQVTGRQRWRARLLPASTLNPVGAWLREAADVFGWLDAAGLRIRRAVRGPGRPRGAD